MDELLEQFLIEGRDLVAIAYADFAALARNPQSTGSIDSAFRAIHTLKGSVAVFAMAPAERVLHAAEDILERARKGSSQLDHGTVAALVAALDQVDRWIDEIERSGVLGNDAGAIANQSLALLAPTPHSPAATALPAGGEIWVGDLMVREAEALTGCSGPPIAFRYTPDADCFFRGDDPLAVIAQVPELVAIAFLPVTGEWPAAAEIEPFSCFTRIEGVSCAPHEALTAVFRMMPDQVAFAALDRTSLPDQTPASDREQRNDPVIRVDPARVDALGDALGELLVAVNAVTPLAVQAAALDRDLAARIRTVQADLEKVTRNLHATVSAVRAVPLAPTLRRLPRLVREIAQGLGKTVEFEIVGGDIEVDKQIADGLFEPLLHLLRNAIDHGIEPAERRVAVGKPVAGRVSLAFRRDGDMIVARLSDDGAGMDPERIRRAALDRGVIDEVAAEALSDSAALRLIFAPGFSTAAEVTEVSGRGVGMNAVENAVETLRGSIEIESVPGRGTAFTLHLSANALTTRLLVIEAGGDRYGVALDQVIETVGVANDRLMPVGEGVACVLHGRTVPVLSLAALLGAPEPAAATAKLLVTRSGGEMVALRVDGFGERIDSLVRRPSGILASVPGIIGSAFLGDGGVLLVLNLPELAA